MKNTLPFSADDHYTLALCGTLGLLGVILYALRAYSASTTRQGRWRKDFVWVSVALVLGIASFSCMTVTMSHGLGHRISELSYREIQLCIQGVFAFLILNLAALSAVKMGIVALILSIQNPTQKYRVWFLWAVGFFQVAVNFVTVFMVIFACAPVDHAWNPAKPGTCKIELVFAKFGIFQGTISGMVDCILGLWPLTMVGGLNVSFRAKFCFCLLIGITVLPGIVSIYRGILTYNIIASPDVIYSWMILLRWSSVELWLIIIMGSISTLRPLFILIFWGSAASRDGIPEGDSSLWHPGDNAATAQIRTVIHGNAPAEQDSDEESLRRVTSKGTAPEHSGSRQFSSVSQMKIGGGQIVVEKATMSLVEKMEN